MPVNENLNISKRNFILGGKIWFLLVFCFFGYAVFNRGFAYIGYYPIFVGELTLFFYLMSLRNGVLLPDFLKTAAGKLWLAYFLYSFIIFLVSATQNLSVSVRMSILWVYTLFFYIGYSYGRRLIRTNGIIHFEKLLLVISFVSLFYCAIYPLWPNLKEATSFLYSGQALFGDSTTVHAVLIGFIFYFLYVKRLLFRPLWVALGFGIILVLLQARGAILGVGCVFLYIFIFDKQNILFNRIKFVFLVFVFILCVYFGTGVTAQGHRGKATAAVIQETIYSIFQQSDEQNGLQGPKEDRIRWWKSVIDRTCSSDTTFIFGLGFNTVLNDAVLDGVSVWYPHNSFLSVFGFSGMLGLVLYLSLCAAIFIKIFKVSRFKPTNVLLRWYPVFAIGYFVSAFFSTVFEAPFHSFVFWVLSGVIYHIAIEEDGHGLL